VHVVGMFSHFNRLADAVGVEFHAPQSAPASSSVR
jgi:hypothetical protein